MILIISLGFAYLLQPFKWPFIIIPNLPIDLINMVESPVPFLIGILGDKTSKVNLINTLNTSANIVMFQDNKLELIVKENMTCDEPYLRNLKEIIRDNLTMANYYLGTNICLFRQ